MKKQFLLLTLLNSLLFSSEIIIDTTLQLPDSIYRDNTKEVVIDPKTNLIWQDNADTKTVQRNWQSAKDYCKNLNLNGYNDWYLPTKEQLQSIIDKTGVAPEIRVQFQNSFSGKYWSSSPDESDFRAWGVDFTSYKSSPSYAYLGSTRNYYKVTDANVRCVRAEQFGTTNFEQIVFSLTEKELQSIPKPPSQMELVKGEFETTKAFEARVGKTKQQQKKAIEQYQITFETQKRIAKQNAIKKALEITWGKPILSNLRYDADNGYFIADISFEAKKDFQNKVAIKVPLQDAKVFKESFSALNPQAVFDYEGGSVKLREVRVPYQNQNYLALFTDIKLQDTQVAVNIKNDLHVNSFNSSITVANDDVQHLDTSKLNNFGELDALLKDAKTVPQDSHKWLFVIGIEKYQFTDNISYAQRSAEMFAKTAQKRLGVLKENTFSLINEHATETEIKTNMKKLIARVKAGDTIYFYYNGHGVPVPARQNEPYMLASNAEPDYVADEDFFSLKNIYKTLGGSKASKVVAFVDSCFSGVTDGKSVLKGVAATKMVPRAVEFDKEKMVVLTAGKGNQYSNGYDKKGYRLFSFFVMKNILEGKTDIGTLYKDTKSETYDTSIQEYGDLRTQEPTVDGNFRLSL